MPWQVKRETMDKRKKLYILVWINGTFSLIFERGALHFHFCVSPCKLGSWPCLPSSAYCLPHPSSHKSYPVKVRSLSKLQTSSLYQRQEKSERVGDASSSFTVIASLRNLKVFPEVFSQLWAPQTLSVAKKNGTVSIWKKAIQASVWLRTPSNAGVGKFFCKGQVGISGHIIRHCCN